MKTKSPEILAFLLFLFLFPFTLYGQESPKSQNQNLDLEGQNKSVKGKVLDTQERPLIGVLVLSGKQSTLTDSMGNYFLPEVADTLCFRLLGFKMRCFTTNDSIPSVISLDYDDDLAEIVIESSSTFSNTDNTQHNEILTEKELTKAPCCNLSESFETNATVDVNYSDAVSGARQIQLLGLDGKYVQINRENLPVIRGLTSRFALGYVPGSYLQSIDVGLGAGSVIYGFESMTGQINLGFKHPEFSEKRYFYFYTNSLARTEVNANFMSKSNHNHNDTSSSKTKKGHWQKGHFFHVSINPIGVDRNNDGFYDNTLSRQLNTHQRWHYEGKNWETQFGVSVVYDEKLGGQSGFNWRDNAKTSPLFGYTNQGFKAEVFGKTGFLFPENRGKGLGILYSLSNQNLSVHSGRRAYFGQQNNFYLNSIYQTFLGNSFHTLKSGFSFLADDYKEKWLDNNFSRTEWVPGLFGEYTFSRSSSFSAVYGQRLDYHSIFGLFHTPRLHLKWMPAKKLWLRWNVGRGFRTPNAIAENTALLVSGRSFRFQNELKPEISWNFGVSLRKEAIKIGEKSIDFSAHYFYTFFEQMLLVDRDLDRNAVYFYTTSNSSFAHSFQTEVKIPLIKNTDLRVAYKWYDVQQKQQRGWVNQSMVSTHRFFLNLGYASRFDKWTADLTFQFFGSQRLPDMGSHQGQHVHNSLPTRSPNYATINAQIGRGTRWNGVFFIGVENLTDRRQLNPIIEAQNPFSTDFDGSMVWGPVIGRLFNAGFRYKME